MPDDSLRFSFSDPWQKPASAQSTWGEVSLDKPAQDRWAQPLEFNLGGDRKASVQGENVPTRTAPAPAPAKEGLTFLFPGQTAAADPWRDPVAQPRPRAAPASLQGLFGSLEGDAGDHDAHSPSSAGSGTSGGLDTFRSPLAAQFPPQRPQAPAQGWGAETSRPADSLNAQQLNDLRGIQALMRNQMGARPRPADDVPDVDRQVAATEALIQKIHPQLQTRRQCYALLQAQQKTLLQQLANEQGADGPSPANIHTLQQLQQLTLQMQQIQQQQGVLEAKLQQATTVLQRLQQRQAQAQAQAQAGSVAGLMQQLQAQMQAQAPQATQAKIPGVFDASALENSWGGQSPPQASPLQPFAGLQRPLQPQPQPVASEVPAASAPAVAPAAESPAPQEGFNVTSLLSQLSAPTSAEGVSFSGLAAPMVAPVAVPEPKAAPAEEKVQCIEWGKPAAPVTVPKASAHCIEWGKPAQVAKVTKVVDPEMAAAFEEMKEDVETADEREVAEVSATAQKRHQYSEETLLDICLKMPPSSVKPASLPSGLFVAHSQKPELLSNPMPFGRFGSGNVKRNGDDDEVRADGTASSDDVDGADGTKWEKGRDGKPLQPLGLNGSQAREQCRFGGRCKKQNCTFAHSDDRKFESKARDAGSPFGQFVASSKVSGMQDVPPPSEKTVAQKIDELISKDASERARDFELRTGVAEKTVYIVGIDSATSDENVLIRLSQFGSIRKYQLCGDSSQPTRYGFFEYNTVFGAKGCMVIDGKKMFNRPVRVSRAKDAIKGGRSIPDGHQTELLRKAAVCVAQKVESLASLKPRETVVTTRRRARSPATMASTLVPVRAEGSETASRTVSRDSKLYPQGSTSSLGDRLLAVQKPGEADAKGDAGRWQFASGASADDSVGHRNSSSPNSEVIEGMSQSNSTGSLAEHSLTPMSSPNSEQKSTSTTSLWAKRDTAKATA